MADLIAAACFLLGLLVFSVGAGLVFLPAGVMAAGASLVAVTWLWARGVAKRSRGR